MVVLFQQFFVVIGRREVVGSQIDADHVGLIATEVPLFTQERRLLAEVWIPCITRVFVLCRHIRLGITRLGTVVVAIGSNATACDYPMLSLQIACGNRGVGIIVVLGGIVEALFLFETFVAIAAGNGIADEFDLS